MISKSNRLVCAFLASLLAVACNSSHAADYTWDGTVNNWNTAHWLPGPVAGPTATGNTATINSGTVTFSINDTFGIHSTASTPVVNLNSGGTLASGGRYTTIIGLNLNGGTLLANGGVNNPFGAFGLKGTVTAGGSAASAISLGAGSFNTISIGTAVAGGTTTFDVADVTTSSAADLTVAVPLNNMANVQSGIVKTGAGTMTLTGANVYTGTTAVNGGTLDVAAGGSLTGAGNINTTAGGVLAISGAVTLASGRVFATGNGISGTTGTVIVNSGGSLSIGNGGSATLIGGSTSANSLYGAGTLTVNGGTVTVAAAGAGGSSNDATTLWLNPYGSSATSTINLDGGLLTTARPVSPGSAPAAQAVVNLNGGVFQAAANSGGITGGTVQVRNGGARIDTQAFNITIGPALLHSGIGGDNAIDGGLTKTGGGTLTLGGAGTYTGNVTVSAGSLVASAAASGGSSATTGFGNLQGAGKTIAIRSGATLVHGNNDLYFNGAANFTATRATVILDGGMMNTGSFYSAVKNLELRSGASITGTNGVNSQFRSLALTGTVTCTGGTGVASTMSAPGAMGGFHLGHSAFGVTSTTFHVDAASGGLHVAGPLVNQSNSLAAGSLVKTGDGTLTLSGGNTYTGITTISDGTLLINGIHSGAGLISASSGGTLGGTGEMVNVAIEADGALSPGTSAGTITMDNLTLDIFSNLDLQLGNPLSLNGSDKVVVNGALTVNVGAMKLNVSGLSGLGTPFGGEWLVMTYGSLGPGTDLGNLTLGSDTTGLGLTIDTSRANQVWLVAVPEAGTSGLVIFGLILLGRRTHRGPRAG